MSAPETVRIMDGSGDPGSIVEVMPDDKRTLFLTVSRVGDETDEDRVAHLPRAKVWQIYNALGRWLEWSSTK